jgi:probable DNA metabolism protein
VRFSLISKQGDDELFYSKIEPDHDILPVIAPHFADRVSVMKFILHDKKRDKAVFCENREMEILPLGILK